MRGTDCDILIVGAGIVGLTLARELVRWVVDGILVVEKEGDVGRHASGQNSGVLHAGIYYSEDTLKARFCVQGNRLMKAYCREKGLPLLETGKVVVARKPQEVDTLRELKRRADACGAKAYIVDEVELRETEPYARTCGHALFTLETAVIDPLEVLRALRDEVALSGKARILFETAFVGLKGDRYKRLVDGRAFLVRGNIYPAPDLRKPFLGVHFTRSVRGDVYVGPTAIPAFGRESYGVLDRLNRESVSILLQDLFLVFKNHLFRSAAFAEPAKYLNFVVWREARSLVPELRLKDLCGSRKVGIRPQLVRWPDGKLIGDFLVVRDSDSLHVLNAISPAFTSSMVLAGYLADLISEAVEGGSREGLSNKEGGGS